MGGGDAKVQIAGGGALDELGQLGIVEAAPPGGDGLVGGPGGGGAAGERGGDHGAGRLVIRPDGAAGGEAEGGHRGQEKGAGFHGAGRWVTRRMTL